MSVLLVDVAVVGGGFLLGRWIIRSIRARGAMAGARAAAAGNAAPAREDLLAGHPCKLGDVLVRTSEGDEAWLAGALVFEEDRPLATLFIAPEAGGDRAIWVRAGSREVTWLVAVQARAVPEGLSEPPHTLELNGLRFERTRRLPAKVSRIGSGAPTIASPAIVAEYTATGATGPARLVLVTGGGQTLAWQGAVLPQGTYEILPGEEPHAAT